MKKVLVGSLLIVTLVIGMTGGTVLAQSADEESGMARTLADRVAEILGLYSATVADAIQQASDCPLPRTLLRLTVETFGSRANLVPDRSLCLLFLLEPHGLESTHTISINPI